MKNTTPSRLLLALLLSAAPALAQSAPQAAPPADRIRVGTWNIENLGSRKDRRTDADYERLGKYIADLGVDVLGVQEINGAEPLAKLCKAAGPSWSFVVGTSGKIGRRPKGSRQITVGFLYDTTRVDLISAHELNTLPRKSGDLWIFHRIPVVATFRAKNGNLDFRAVVVHFKAGRLGVNDRSPKDSAKRQAEVKHLAKSLLDTLKAPNEDQDLLILGDYNSGPSYPAFKELARSFTPTAPKSAHRSIIWFDEQIDHILLSNGLRDEYVPGSCVIRHELFTKLGDKAWKAQYSDHIPVVLELDASKDRDPQANLTKPTEHVLLPFAKNEKAVEKAVEKPVTKPETSAKPKAGTKRWF